jgi:uncharacterized Fe-S cluster-containing radical SAM superfamily protein
MHAAVQDARERVLARQRAAWRQTLAVGWMQALLLRLRAWLTGRRFTCEALGGRSSYNICVNSDMTVSCNCQDYDKSGELGDLRSESLEEIMRGPRASRLRQALASGRIPLATCSRCQEIRLVDAAEARRLATAVEVPRKGLMVENTVRCNLTCTSCPRDLLLGTRQEKQWRAGDVDRVAETIAAYGIETVSFFNLGEPFFPRSASAEIATIRARNPHVKLVVSTNGVLIEGDQVEGALKLDHIMVSLDGDCQATVDRYQVGMDFDRAYRNLAALVAERRRRGSTSPIIEWKYVVFRWNDRPEQVERAVRLAREAGVDRISFWPAVIPVTGISWRYRLARHFRSIPTWRSGGVPCVLELGTP